MSAKFYQDEAFRLDATGHHQDITEQYYLKALELDPSDIVNWRRYVAFLTNLARHSEAEKKFREALLILPRNRDLYMGLHVPYCGMLLDHGDTELAKGVLADIPSEIHDKNIDALRNVCTAFQAAQDGIDVFPLSVPAQKWDAGPHLTSHENIDRWFAGKIEWFDDLQVSIRMGEPPFTLNGQYIHSRVQRESFESLIQKEIGEERFLEIVFRHGKEEPEVYLHPVGTGKWREDFPEQELDTYRYMR